MSRTRHQWQCRSRRLALGERTAIMGVLNLTPDSFSDGGRYADPAAAVDRALWMVEEGADILDLGGESTRPGALPVDADEERRRVLPVLDAVRRQSTALLSIDTRKADVARAALDAGADIVNDISALSDPGMADAVRDAGAGLVMMHMRGEPRTMQDSPAYADVVEDVRAHLAARVTKALEAGIDPTCIALDPGIGFGKTPAHNLRLLTRLDRLAALGQPLLLGISRKSLLGHLTGRPVGDRLAAALALTAYIIARGAHMVRTHDVKETCDAARVADTMLSEDKC